MVQLIKRRSLLKVDSDILLLGVYYVMLRKAVAVFVIAFSAFMVIGRLLSGVHWATDIIGSVLLSAGLYMLYRSTVLSRPGLSRP